MPYGTVNADLMTTSDGVSSSGLYGFKNRIINGAMMIDQRNAGGSVSPMSGSYAVDRWVGSYLGGGTGRFSAQQSSTAPSGFVNSWLITVTTADASPSAAYGYEVQQWIEGYNIADLGFGTASASPITVSFWVRSSVTGTFPLIIYNGAGTRAFGGTYTVNSANTFEYKTVTIAGDTSGTWATNNTAGLSVIFGFGGGSSRTISTGWQAASGSTPTNVTGCTNLMATNGATFYITGVQLEKGSTATSFDYRPYGTELQLCQRYCLVYSNSADGEARAFGFNYTTTSALAQFYFPVQTRVKPTGISVSTSSNFTLYSAGTSFAISSIAYDNGSNKTANVTVTSSGLTQGGGCILGFQTAGNKLEFTGMEL